MEIDARVARAREWFRRAVRADGHERQMLALVVKSALAATAAWYVSEELIGAESPAFAPFSAVLMMQVTVYQAVAQAVRYVGAVCVGVLLQSGLGFLIGPNMLTFGLVALAALAIGRWQRLGAQGTQVATAAFFAFSMFVTSSQTSERLTQLGQIILLVLIGSGIGVLVNLVVLPPLRYRGAQHGVRTLASGLHELIADITPALCDNQLDAEDTAQWRRRAEQLRPIIDQADDSMRTARESLWFNPRRLLNRGRARVPFARYEELTEALQRVTYQVGSLTRSLDHLHGEGDALDDGFLSRYGDLLSGLDQVTRVLAEIEEDRLADQLTKLNEATDKAERTRRDLAAYSEQQNLPLADPTRPYGILLAEATRLTEEFRHTTDVLTGTTDDSRDESTDEGSGREH